MKHVIYKYKLNESTLDLTILLMSDDKVVRFAPQGDGLYIWVEKVIESAPNTVCFSRSGYRTFEVAGTGHEYKGKYLMSCEQGNFIWHLTEVV